MTSPCSPNLQESSTCGSSCSFRHRPVSSVGNISCCPPRSWNGDENRASVTIPRSGSAPCGSNQQPCCMPFIQISYPDFVTTSSFLCCSDMRRMWDLIAQFIDRRLASKKAVSLPGLGTFSLNTQKVFVGQGVYKKVFKPTFMVNGKFALIHRMPRSQETACNVIPTVMLNFTILARMLAVDRDKVEMAYTETVEQISALIRHGKKVVLPFRCIGELHMRLETVKMFFKQEFFNRIRSERLVLDVD